MHIFTGIDDKRLNVRCVKKSVLILCLVTSWFRNSQQCLSIGITINVLIVLHCTCEYIQGNNYCSVKYAEEHFPFKVYFRGTSELVGKLFL